MESYELYQFRSLGSDADEIRLLKLHPGQPNEIISAEIVHTSVRRLQDFEALSYAWGDPKSRTNSKMLVGGALFAITQNLDTALRHIRDPIRAMTLWVDAVCINQTDLIERNNQLQIMRRIFESAGRVIVWLGEETHGSIDGMRGLKTLSRYASFTGAPKSGGRESRLRTSFDKVSRYVRSQPNLLQEMLALLARPWFERVWVIQELVVARRAVIRCGSKCLNWKSFSNALAVLVHLDMSTDSCFTGGPPFQRALKIDRHRRKNLPSADLKGLVHDYRDNLASDPRDKLYSLYGLAEDVRMLPSIDYSAAISEIYTRFASFVIGSSNSLDLLHAVQSSTIWQLPCLELPSWVPDWRQPWHSISLKDVFRRYVTASEIYTVARPPILPDLQEKPNVRYVRLDYATRLEVSVDISGSLETLSVFGVIWSTISSILDTDSFNCNTLPASVQFWRRLPEPEAGTAAGSSTRDVHDITLGFNKVRKEKGAVIPGGKLLVRMENGQVGLTNPGVEASDLVCFLHDQSVPLVLRRIKEDYVLVGQFLASSVLDGQAITDNTSNIQIFKIR